MKKMRAAVFEGEGVLKIKDVDYPVIKKPTQLIIKVEAASICGSDLHGLAVPPGQYMKPGIIYGHEFCGTIVEMGSEVRGFKIGEMTAVNPRVRCGRCYECTHNKGDLCSNSSHYGQLADGGFSEYALVDERQLYHVESSIPSEIAAQAEPMACIMNAVKTAQPAPVDYVLLYGAGPIGLSFIRVLKVYGIRNLIAAAKGEKRVQEAYACGADVVVDVSRESVADVVKEHWPFKADLVIDAVGRGNVLEEAVHLVNPKGRIVLFGLDQNAAAAIPPAVLTLNEVKMEGVLGKDFPAALEILKNPELQLEKIITHRVSLENIHVGIELMRKKEACRVIVFPHGIEEKQGSEQTP
ncbi:MAG: alcohol dehydrogenase catalytic domain-containing protein [Lachnospiraceae bacterium]|nr:alcohol dehydrogenase catalytic domain-containing protein [Lachnospiraceae bacterium]